MKSILIQFRHTILMIFLLSSVLVPNISNATTYYIKNGGSDGAAGTSDATAWEHLSKASSLAQSSDVYLKCGDTWTEEIITVNWTGTSGDGIVIGAYYMDGSETVGVNEDGKPIIDGNNVEPTTDTSGLINVNSNKDYVTIQDLEIINSNGHSIQIYGADHVNVYRCKMETAYRCGIYFNGNYGEISYNEISDVSRKWLTTGSWPAALSVLQADYVNCYYNYVHGSYGEGILSGDYSIIKYNLVVDQRSIHIYLHGIHDAEVAYNLIVGTSETTHEYTSGWHAEGIGLCTEDTGSTIGDVYNNDVHHNIVINTYGGLRIYSKDTDSCDSNPCEIYDNYLYNNTLIDNYHNMFFTSLTYITGDIIIKNNISHAPHADSDHANSIGLPSYFDCDYNLWFTNGGADPAPTGANWPGTYDQYDDPNFGKSGAWRGTIDDITDISTSDFYIGSGSDATDNGVDLGSSYDDSIASGSDMITTNPDPNSGDPITVSTLDQDDYSPWDIGACILAPPPPSTFLLRVYHYFRRW